MPDERLLDDADRALVAALQADGRASVRTLAADLHLSRASAYARLQRLREDGVVTGFSADVDPTRLGLGTAAYVAISIEQNSWQTVVAGLRAIDAVERVSLVAADFDVLALVRTHDNAELRTAVLERIQSLPGVRATRTWLIFEEQG